MLLLDKSSTYSSNYKLGFSMHVYSKYLLVFATLVVLVFSAQSVSSATIASYGAVCDGLTDDIGAFNNASADLANGTIAKLEIGGDCNLSAPWYITGNLHFKNVVIEAWGASVNNTVIVAASGVSIKGLSVENSPSDGFVFIRGQGGNHEQLSARNNAGHGFYFGTRNGTYGFNSQISNVVFTLPSAIGNSGDGFRWDGKASANRSWLNASTFIQPVARGNIGASWTLVPGVGPNGPSRTNYNTIISAQFEANGGIAKFPGSRAYTFIGGHFVDQDSAGNSAEFGDISYIFGGRYTGSIKNKQSKNTILVNTAAPGEGARMHYLRLMDMY